MIRERLLDYEAPVGTESGIGRKERLLQDTFVEGLWYRNLIEHSGSIATAQEWF
jgi:hypothetical protein